MQEQPAQPQLLVQYCKADDFDAATGQCVAPFYGPEPRALPRFSAADAFELTGVIAACWAIGFIIKRARRSIH